MYFHFCFSFKDKKNGSLYVQSSVLDIVFCMVDGRSPLLRVYELRTPVKADMPSAGSYRCYYTRCERTSRPASDLSFFWHHEDCTEFARAFIQANVVYLECEALKWYLDWHEDQENMASGWRSPGNIESASWYNNFKRMTCL